MNIGIVSESPDEVKARVAALEYASMPAAAPETAGMMADALMVEIRYIAELLNYLIVLADVGRWDLAVACVVEINMILDTMRFGVESVLGTEGLKVLVDDDDEKLSERGQELRRVFYALVMLPRAHRAAAVTEMLSDLLDLAGKIFESDNPEESES